MSGFGWYFRNFGYVLTEKPATVSKARKRMRAHRATFPACEYCGRSRKVDVHHKIPVSYRPDLAADPNNLLTLCRRPACHHVVGHCGNWKDFNAAVDDICSVTDRVTKDQLPK